MQEQRREFVTVVCLVGSRFICRRRRRRCALAETAKPIRSTEHDADFSLSREVIHRSSAVPLQEARELNFNRGSFIIESIQVAIKVLCPSALEMRSALDEWPISHIGLDILGHAGLGKVKKKKTTRGTAGRREKKIAGSIVKVFFSSSSSADSRFLLLLLHVVKRFFTTCVQASYPKSPPGTFFLNWWNRGMNFCVSFGRISMSAVYKRKIETWCWRNPMMMMMMVMMMAIFHP